MIDSGVGQQIADSLQTVSLSLYSWVGLPLLSFAWP
jgi:hypothetical protein